MQTSLLLNASRTGQIAELFVFDASYQLTDVYFTDLYEMAPIGRDMSEDVTPLYRVKEDSRGNQALFINTLRIKIDRTYVAEDSKGISTLYLEGTANAL